MATAQEIIDAAGGNYPSTVKERAGEPGWLDLTSAVRVVINGATGTRFEGVCLLNPLMGLAILNNSDIAVPIADLVVAQFQGRTSIGNELTEADMDELEIFLNIVADERTQSPYGSGQVQTANAVAARVFISRFFMRRKKGLSYNHKSGS